MITFSEFISIKSKEEKLPYYIKVIADRIEEKIMMGISTPRLLIVTMPPRSYKTTISSNWLPRWTIENIPYKTIGIFSYSAEIVKDHVQRYLSDLSIRIYNLNKHPNMKTDVCIIDDYCKSDTEGKSTKYHDLVFHNFMNMANNIMTNAFILIMASRWDKDDLVGRLLTKIKKDGIPFLVDYINLPSLATVNDVLGRDINTPIWPEKHSTERLCEIKNIIGSGWFETMYQGRPT